MPKLVKISGAQASQPESPFSLAVCKQCLGPNCCEIEPPFLTGNDIKNIADATGLSANQFSEAHRDEDNRPIHQMKQNENHKCFFYDQESRRCRIYENRPVDCRLFPLDIAKVRDRYTWIMYTSCPLESPVARQTAVAMVSSAEAVLLPELEPDLPAYADCGTASFEQGRWIEVSEVRRAGKRENG